MTEVRIPDLRMATVLVVGGTSGIGLAVVNMLNGLGVTTFAPEKGQLNVKAAKTIIQTYLAASGHAITHMVYSAGINELCWIKDIDDYHSGNYTNFTRVLDVNVTGFARVLGSLIGYHPLESVVAISSDAATRPMRGSLMYCASKAALDMAVKCAARELAPETRVNAVAPGMTDGTVMQEYIDKAVPEFRGWTPEAARSYENSQNPMGRRATTDEIAHAVVDVLFGPEYMTGTIVTVNGGR